MGRVFTLKLIMTPHSWIFVTSICAFLGLLPSVFLSYKHFYGDDDSASFSDFGGVVNCSEVLGTEWAYFLRAPIAVLDFSYNAMLLYVSEDARSEIARKPRLDAACVARLNTLGFVLLAGIGFVGYLIGVEMYLGKICPMCTIVHILTAIATYACRAAGGSVFSLPKTLPENWMSVLTVGALLFGSPLIYFNRSLVSQSVFGGNGEPQSLVDCLVAKKVEVLGHAQCDACREQQRLLGDDALRIYREVMVDNPKEDLQQPEWLLDGEPSTF